MVIIKWSLAKKTILWFLLIMVMSVIFYFSHQSGEGSQNTSDSFIDNVFVFLPAFFRKIILYLENEDILSFLIRKCAHFSLYFSLGGISYCLAYEYSHCRSLKNFLISILFSVFYAITDEFHQWFIPGRSAEITDVLLDSSGAFCGICIVLLSIIITKKQKK